jgi:hypothetical protein
MTKPRLVRMLLVLVPLILAMWWVCLTKVEPQRVNLIVTTVIGAVTAIYALFTYEILVQNQTMADAALESSKLMEKSLRFSLTPNLLFKTINTKDPTFEADDGSIAPFQNEDYKRALAQYKEGEQQQGEYVFAVVSNKGQGAATNLNFEAIYNTIDSSNLNRANTVRKHEVVQILEPKTAIAICVFISKIPAPGDGVGLVSAKLVASDFYLDAIKEPPQTFEIRPANHHCESEPNSVVSLS